MILLIFLNKMFHFLFIVEIKISFVIGEEEKNGLMKLIGQEENNSKRLNIKIGNLMVHINQLII